MSWVRVPGGPPKQKTYLAVGLLFWMKSELAQQCWASLLQKTKRKHPSSPRGVFFWYNGSMNRSNTFDVALIFGSGVKDDGSLPESSIACVKKAVSLFRANKSMNLITCGRWAYNLPFTPSVTEAEALRSAAIKLGFPPENIYTEDESITTVSNACLAKKAYLEPNNWKRVALISVYPQSTRALYNLEYVLGSRYSCELVLADFKYPKEKKHQLESIESQKIIAAKNFLEVLPAGAHEVIFKAAMADLKKKDIES